MPALTIGTATARPGKITIGEFTAVSLPSGGSDSFPVMIAQGKQADGPVLWLTTGIHGGEQTGLIVLHHLMTEALVSALRGTVVAIPTLNPGGLRTRQRQPYYLQGDPNRYFPPPNRPSRPAGEDGARPRPEIEDAYRRLYDAIVESGAACLLDLHNAWVGSIPFAFRDPVFYRRGRGGGLTRNEARRLQDRVGEMLGALGLTVINEFAADDYVNKNLHRSVSGSVLNGAAIPAATLELGSWMHVDAGVVEAALGGLRNVMRWLGMLAGEREAITGIPAPQPGYPVRRHVFPYAPQTGIAHRLVRPGEPIATGQPLVRMTDITGRALGPDDGIIASEHDGFVIAWHHGVVFYQGEPMMDLAIRDDSELIIPYPD